MITYSLIKERHLSSETEEYIAYGIDVIDGKDHFTIHDVFLDKDEGSRCIDLFNREQLEAVHLEQILDEYLRYG